MRYRTWGRSRGNRLAAPLYQLGRAIHVIVGTARSTPIFDDPLLAATAFEPLVDHHQTLAASVLPAHVHWLIRYSHAISATVGRYKSLVTAKARALGCHDRIWQRSFWDHVVRDRDKLDRIVRYVVENPMRAGLCERYEDYPWVVVFADRIDAIR